MRPAGPEPGPTPPPAALASPAEEEEEDEEDEEDDAEEAVGTGEKSSPGQKATCRTAALWPK